MATLPEHIGPYEIEGELGRGSFGVVYRARRGPGAEPCALKVFLEPGDAEQAARFKREVELISQLDHPGIVSALESGHYGRYPWLAMELVDGETLEERLRRGPLGAEAARALMIELAEALGYAHERGVVHRDVKPANVIFSRQDQRARLTDFGMASRGAAVDSLTRTGDVLGTPYYMAPEQLVDAKRADARADVYALGVVLYQCLSGELPFKGATAHQVFSAIQRGAPPSVRRLAPNAPRALLDACERAMAKQPEKRFRTARDLADALREGQRQPQGLRREQAAALVVAGGAACGLLVVALGWALTRGEPPREESPRQVVRDVERARPSPPPEPAPPPRPRLADLDPAAIALETLQGLGTSDAGESARDEFARGVLARAASLAAAHSSYDELRAWTSEAERIAASETLRAQAQLDCATYAFRRGRFEEASERARAIRAPGRLGFQARYVAAYGQLWLDRYTPALEALKQIWQDDPQGVVGQNAGAVFNSHTGRNDVGERLARAALALDPDYVDAYCSLAFCLNDLSHREPARKAELLAASLEASTRANQLSPDHPRPLLARAYALGNSGRPREALRAYDELIRLTQPRPMGRALRQRARYRWTLDRDRAGAIEDLDAAIERDPHDAEALVWRGIFRDDAGERELAAQDWVRAAQADQQAVGRALRNVQPGLRERIVSVIRQRLAGR